MDLTVNLAPSYRDLKDPTTRQNFDDTLEQKRVIDLRACRILVLQRSFRPFFVLHRVFLYVFRGPVQFMECSSSDYEINCER